MYEEQSNLIEETVNSINNKIVEFQISSKKILNLAIDDLGELNLLEFHHYFVFFDNIINDLKKIDIIKIPLTTLNQIFDLIQDINTLYLKIIDSLLISFIEVDKIQIGQSLSEDYYLTIQVIIPFISYFTSINNYNSLKNDILEQKRTYKSIIESAEKELKSKIVEFDIVIQKSKETTAKENVQIHAHIFNSESILHKKAANWSLGLVIGIIISIVTFSIYYILVLIPEIKPEETMKIIQYSIAKLIILSSLFYGLSLSVKSFKAHKHNEIVNKHRQNALSTFQTFSMAADNDPSVKNAILLEATRTIFSAQQSGYLTNESESDNPNRIIEIIKNVTTMRNN